MSEDVAVLDGDFGSGTRWQCASRTNSLNERTVPHERTNEQGFGSAMRWGCASDAVVLERTEGEGLGWDVGVLDGGFEVEGLEFEVLERKSKDGV